MQKALDIIGSFDMYAKPVEYRLDSVTKKQAMREKKCKKYPQKILETKKKKKLFKELLF